jgi:Ca2+-binding RTX toxin-like protein
LLVTGFGQIAHYGSLNDLIWRIGAGHLGGNVYSFAGLDFANLNPQTNEPYLLDTISAHKIETGFYYPLTEFNRAGVSAFDAAASGGPMSSAHLSSSYLQLDSLQKLASGLGNIFRQSTTTSGGAMAKLLFGGLGGFVLGDSDQVNALVRAYVDTRYRAGKYQGKEDEYEAAKDTDWAFRMRVAAAALGASNIVQGPFGLVLKAAAAIALAPVYKLVEGVSNDDGEFVLRQTFQLQRQGASVPDGSYEEALERSSLLGAALGVPDPDGSRERLTTVAELARDDVDGFAEAMVSSESDWYLQTAGYLAARASALGKQEKVQTALNEFWSYSREAAENNPTQLAAVSDQFERFTLDWSNAVANVSNDLAAPRNSSLQIAGLDQYAQKKPFWDSVLAGLEGALDLFVGTAQAAETRDAVSRAIDDVRSAAETVVVAAGRPSTNPFDDPNFDPGVYQLPSLSLSEGSIETFTAFLPYEAGEGGERIRFKLAGTAADKITAIDEEVELDADGTFTFTVAEGQREVSFGLWAREDIDADATLTLSATLVDESDLATHLEHDEATVTLGARDEAAPAGGMELHGDWGLKLYPITYSDGTPVLDSNGNQVYGPRPDPRYPHLMNLERDPNGRPDFGEQAQPLMGLDGADHIWLGEFGGAGSAFGLSGDDYFEGKVSVPNRIVGDHVGNYLGYSGNDTIEGGESLRPYSDPGFTREGEHIEGIGDDILIGGPGDDQIYADRIVLLDATLDPNTPALDQKGDWITGEQGDDRIFGSAAHDALFGGGGADVIRGGAGNDVLDGDDNYYNWGDAWWEVDPGFFGVTFFPVTNLREQTFEYYRDFGGGDVLDGGAGDDLILGMLGEDILIGGLGADRLEGWEGDDQLFGGAGDDILAGDFGRDEQPWMRMPGAAYRVMPGAVGLFSGDASEVNQVGNDYLAGGAGNDLLLGEAGADVLLGEEGDDVLEGDAGYLAPALHGADLLDGGPGADSLSGQGGDDQLFGGPGADQLSGGEGNDRLSGGTEDDLLLAGEGDDWLSGDAGSDQLDGGAGNDSLWGGEGDDELDGGEGNDSLYAGDGADRLDGGEGNDALYGGAGEDELSGGDGDDLIDAGGGIDIVRGGSGDDIYVLSLGYGSDLIEDSAGNNRLRFGAGITPGRLSAELDGATLGATVNYGFGGDAATFDLTQFQIGGAEFADGTLWTRKDFLRLVPALATEGSNGAEIIAGSPFVRNELRGLGGDDSIAGSANDDLLAGGDGADMLDGAAGSDVYFFGATEGGVDRLADSTIEARAYLEWFYGKLGIPDWIERGQHGGKYRAVVEGEGSSFTSYYASYDEAYSAFPFATITFVEPLQALAPVVRRDDAAAIDELVAAGVVARDVVEFAPGLTLSDLTLTVTVDAVEAAEHPGQPMYEGGTLAVRWRDAGFDVDVPSVTYGFFGTNLLTDGSPAEEAPGAWRGYRLGEGMEGFRFADGSSYSLEQVLQHAEVVEVAGDYALSRGSGPQLISRNYAGIVFDSSISSGDIAVTRDGLDLLITLSDGSAQGRIRDWYADAAAMPSTSLKFASGEEFDAATLTGMGLGVTGTVSADTLVGLDGFGDVLSGGPGNDTLDGGGGKDTYIFNRGDGVDTIAEAPAGAGDPEASVIIFGPDIFRQVQLGLGSLVVHYGEGDAIHFSAFNPEDPYSTPVFERLEFADGSAMTYDDVLENGFHLTGTEGDDVIIGTAVHDSIRGEAGNDSLSGRDGQDDLQGGEGDDTLAGGRGDGDYIAGDEGADTYIYAAGDGYDQLSDWDEAPGEVDRLQLRGITPSNVRVTRDDYSYYLVLGGADRLILDTAARESAAEIERIEFDDGTLWTAADLAARVQLLPGTELDDVLWGTSGNDVLEGLGGDDSLFGNGGDDLIIGGDGNDFYYFAAGDGADTVDNYDGDGSSDSIYFANASSTEATLARCGDDLVLRIADGSDRVTLSGWYADPKRKIDAVLFGGDGRYWDAAMLEQLAPISGNSAPEVNNALADPEANEDSRFSFTVASDAFVDPDAGDALTYTAGLADGSGLPGWLSFDAGTRGFSGTPLQGDVGELEIRVTATDDGGLAVSDTFILSVANANDAPVLAKPVDDQLASEDTAFSFAVPANTFIDEDLADALAWFASRSDDSALPSWLSFDATERVLSGMPGNADVGSYQIRVSAVDGAGASASAVFRLDVANVNDAPTAATPIPQQSFEAGSPFVFTVLAATFAEVDAGDSLTFSASLFGGAPLPTWLSFDPATASFTGNPEGTLNGIWHLAVNAIDESEATAISDFALIIRVVADSSGRGAKRDDLIYGGPGDETLTGKGGNDYLFGDIGDDLLKGGSGRDVLQGADGNDAVRAGTGQNLLDGGAGDDVLYGGRSSNLVVGGSGNDTIRTGHGNDVILFNRGDGSDTVIADHDADNTLSFGGGIRYSDLSLSKSGKDLVVSAGGDDRIVLRNWYAGKHSVLNLQIVLDASADFDAGSPDPLYNRKVQTFDFLGLVCAFDEVRTASPGLTSWALTNALLQFHLSGSDDAAIGGDLAYWYAKNRGFNGISLAAAQEVLGASGFGSEAQSLRPFSGLQEGFVKLG